MMLVKCKFHSRNVSTTSQDMLEQINLQILVNSWGHFWVYLKQYRDEHNDEYRKVSNISRTKS